MSSEKATEEMDLARRLSVMQLETALVSNSKQHTVIKPAITTLEWRIDQFDLLQRTSKPGEFLPSQEFSTGGIAWRLHFYPNGHSTSQEQHPGIANCAIVRIGQGNQIDKRKINTNFCFCVQNANYSRVVVAQGAFDFFGNSQCILQCPRILQMDGSLFLYLEIRYLLAVGTTMHSNDGISSSQTLRTVEEEEEPTAESRYDGDESTEDDTAKADQADAEDDTSENLSFVNCDSVIEEAPKATEADQVKPHEETLDLMSLKVSELLEAIGANDATDDWERIGTPKRTNSTRQIFNVLDARSDVEKVIDTYPDESSQ